MADPRSRHERTEPDDLVQLYLQRAAHLHESGAEREARGAVAQALMHYEQVRAAWERQATELSRLRAEAALSEEANARLAGQLRSTELDLVQERGRSERRQKRANQLAESLKEVHRSLFGAGDVYGLVLRACLTVVDAPRGLYVTAGRGDGTLRVRAVQGSGQDAEQPPSPWLEALCRRVLSDNSPIVCNTQEEMRALALPVEPDAALRNVAAAPVVLLQDLDGVVVAAERPGAGFERDEVDALLNVGDQTATAIENAQLRRDLEAAYLAIVGALGDAMEARDVHARGHSEEAARYARLTTRRLAMPEQRRAVTCYAALLRDIGKVAISDGVLNKVGPLLPAERELVRAHARLGYDILSRVGPLRPVADVVLHHHERYDGAGYPDGLAREAIPLESRVVAVLDAYAGMKARRSYREPYGEERAREELRLAAGTQFDPRVVDAFLHALDSPAGEDSDDDHPLCGPLDGWTERHGR